MRWERDSNPQALSGASFQNWCNRHSAIPPKKRRRWESNPQAAVKRHSLANCCNNHYATPPIFLPYHQNFNKSIGKTSIFVILLYGNALVVQWTECELAEFVIEVRLLSRALNNSTFKNKEVEKMDKRERHRAFVAYWRLWWLGRSNPAVQKGYLIGFISVFSIVLSNLIFPGMGALWLLLGPVALLLCIATITQPLIAGKRASQGWKRNVPKN